MINVAGKYKVKGLALVSKGYGDCCQLETGFG
jgi:hypothetical protein